MDEAIVLRKAQLRQRLIREREQLPPSIVAAHSMAIVDRLRCFGPLLELLATLPADPVGLYAAFRGEPDIRPLTPFLLENGAQVAFPAIVDGPAGKCLRFGRYEPGQSLAEFLTPGYFGVPEPPAASLLPFGTQMCALIMPGVAFDCQGGRLGFGKGFYDSVIAACPRRPLLIGVAHPFQLLDDPLPLSAHDQRLDFIVLPDRTVVVK